MPMPVRSASAGSTPTHGPPDPLGGVGGDMQEAFAQGQFRDQSARQRPEVVWKRRRGPY